jgi:hypothetical protein
MKIIKGFCFLAVIAATACNQPAKQQEAAKVDTTDAVDLPKPRLLIQVIPAVFLKLISL